MAQDGCDAMGRELTLWVTQDHSKEGARTMDNRKRVPGTKNELLAKQPALTPRVPAEEGAWEVAWVREELKLRQSEGAPPPKRSLCRGSCVLSVEVTPHSTLPPGTPDVITPGV